MSVICASTTIYAGVPNDDDDDEEDDDEVNDSSIPDKSGLHDPFLTKGFCCTVVVKKPKH